MGNWAFLGSFRSYVGNSNVVVLAGMVGMIASALSMGSGANLAAKSEREIYEAEHARECKISKF